MELFGYNIYKDKLYKHNEIKNLCEFEISKLMEKYDSNVEYQTNSVHGNFNIATNRNFSIGEYDNEKRILKFLDKYLEVNIKKYIKDTVGDIGDYKVEHIRRFINRTDYGSGILVHTDASWNESTLNYNNIMDINNKKYLGLSGAPDFTVNYYPIADFGCVDLVLHNPLFYNFRDESLIEDDEDNIWGIESKVKMGIKEGDVIIYPFWLPHSVEYSNENAFFDDNIVHSSERFAIINFIKIIRS